jgi:diguanylate cyclase (GGDEF)-like protein
MNKVETSYDQQKLKLLNGMAMLLQSCVEEEELFDVIYWYLPKLYPASRGGIYLFQKENSGMTQAFAWHSSEEETVSPIPDPKYCQAVKLGRPVDVKKQKAENTCFGCSPRAYCVPLLDAEKAFGVLRIENKEMKTDKHMKGLGFITAEYMALAISNIRLRKRLREMTLRDPLTGLHNRRFLEDAILREIGKASRSGSHLGVIMIDLDHFKHLNDDRGHDAGDVALKAIANTIKASLRSSDIVCRFGGEEFVVLIPEGEYMDCLNRAEELRLAIRSLSILHKGHELGPITSSFGVAAVPEHGDDTDSILKAADKALYAAKASGRDTVKGTSDLCGTLGGSRAISRKTKQ